MKVLNTDFQDYKTGKEWFTIVIDKQDKNIFALTNLSCNAVECTYLSNYFGIEKYLTDGRFYFIHSANDIDINLIPKKYNKFQIL